MTGSFAVLKADRHHQALWQCRRECRRFARSQGRRNSRRARRKRRRQIDADEDHLRHGGAGRRPCRDRRQAARFALAARRDRGRHRHGPPAFHAGRQSHGLRKPDHRHLHWRALFPRATEAVAPRSRNSVSATASTSISMRGFLTSRSASSSASKS